MTLAGIIILVAVLGIAARRLLWHQMRSTRQTPSRTLAPAELAYLLRDGDMPHTLVVMSVDLIQRQIKAGDPDSTPALRSYEKQVWTSVKEFLKQFAQQKAGHLIPMDDLKNPVKWAVRFSALKKFIGENLRSFVADLIQDPRHIKKYFSLAGVARLALHFYTSSVRIAVQRELRQELLQEGFLVTEQRRKQFALMIAALIPAMVASVLLIAFALQFQPFALVPVAMVAGLINAIVVRLLIELPGFIPTFDEFAKVAAELHRGGLRLTVVRTILKAARVIIGIAIALASALLLLGDTALFGFLFQTNPMFVLVAETVLGFSIVACALDYHSLTFRDHASEAGELQMQQRRAEISRLRPLDTYRHVLSDPAYDPTLSQLVAVYGIETLWLLS